MSIDWTCFRFQPHLIVYIWINMQQTFTVFLFKQKPFLLRDAIPKKVLIGCCTIRFHNVSHKDNDNNNPRDLWHLRHWLHFLQLRTWIHDNLYYLTIKRDTGQHSQFLRCFYSAYHFPVVTCHLWQPVIKQKHYSPFYLTSVKVWQVNTTLFRLPPLLISPFYTTQFFNARTT